VPNNLQNKNILLNITTVRMIKLMQFLCTLHATEILAWSKECDINQVNRVKLLKKTAAISIAPLQKKLGSTHRVQTSILCQGFSHTNKGLFHFGIFHSGFTY